jgi:hypothetical protein
MPLKQKQKEKKKRKSKKKNHRQCFAEKRFHPSLRISHDVFLAA